MRIPILFYFVVLCFFTSQSQVLNITGGVDLTKAAINSEVLSQEIQKKQEEVFTRLFSNITVKYFQNSNPTEGVYNFPTYYALYNLVTDLTVGKSKTTVSKSVINSAAELSFIYAFVKYYQHIELSSTLNGMRSLHLQQNLIENVELLDEVSNGQQPKPNKENLLSLNYYLEAAFDVLANDTVIQNKFSFKRPVNSSEISKWYEQLGLKNREKYDTLTFKTVTGKRVNIKDLIRNMQGHTANFFNYLVDDTIKNVIALRKTAIGFKEISKEQINAIKLLLIEYGNKTDFLFDQNVVKNLLSLITENIHFGIDENEKINQVYVDVEGLVLSVSKEFVPKYKRSSVASAAFFINPRLFFTIGTSSLFFLKKSNNLAKGDDGQIVPLKNVTLAAEKIGFRVKLLDFGYTRSFNPGETFKYHGSNRVWTQPQTKPIISSIYYNLYGSGLLYNILDLKTNANFNYGFISSNVGVIFFNGLEFSTGIGIIYNDGLEAKNCFLKVDFDIPIVDYLSALISKRNRE